MYIAKPVVTFLTLFFTLAASAGEEGLLKRLQANHAALTAAQRDYQHQRERGALHDAEAADYADYLARLRERVNRDCLTLARLDIALLEDSPCLANMPRFVMPAPIDQSREQTDAERTATMDAELNTGLGEFDEMLLREQERVKAAAPRADAGGGMGGGGTGSGDAGGQGEGDADGQGEAGTQGAQAGASGDSGELAGRGDPTVSGAGGSRNQRVQRRPGAARSPGGAIRARLPSPSARSGCGSSTSCLQGTRPTTFRPFWSSRDGSTSKACAGPSTR